MLVFSLDTGWSISKPEFPHLSHQAVMVEVGRRVKLVSMRGDVCGTN